MRCLANNNIGPSEETINFLILYVILIHVFSLIAYFLRVNWLRIICVVLYVPIIICSILILVISFKLVPVFFITSIFYYLIIIKKRKENFTIKTDL